MKHQLNSEQNPAHTDDGDYLAEAIRPQLKRPSMYAVVMQNDDYTPMEFVVEVLQSHFAKTLEQATQIMLTVHTQGSAVCAIYTKDVAETKMMLVNQYSRDCQHPLLCDIVPVGEDE